MLVSIITTFYNAETTIQETIDSIVKQNYKNIEVIFVDGSSTDCSLKIVNQNVSKFEKYKIISEPDKGIYDGMNKGIEASTGEVVCILNADDLLCLNALNKVVDLFKDKNVDIVAGTINRFDTGELENGDVFPRTRMNELSPTNPSIHHPGIFVRKRVYNNVGLFNIKYKISADFDFIARAINYGVVVKYTDEVLVNMRNGGLSGALKFHIKKNLEHLLIGFENRKNMRSFLIYSIYVTKKFFYGFLVFAGIKK